MLGRLAVRLVGRLEDGVVHDATVGRGLGGRRADSVGTVAPDLLELSRGNVSTVVSSNGGPELLAAGLVDGAKTVSVDNLWLISYFGVDAETVVGFRRFTGGKGARLGQEDLVLGTVGGGRDGIGAEVGAAIVAQGRAVTRGLRISILVHGHGIGWAVTSRAG